MSHRTRLFDALTAFYATAPLPAKVRPSTDDGQDPEVGLSLVAIGSVAIQPGTVVSGGALVWSGQVILAGQLLEWSVTDDDGAVSAPAEDALEDELAQLLAFLDDVDWLLWSDATRSTWREAFPAYAVTVQIADPGDRP